MEQKFIFVSGGVISGLGKGVVAASIASLLQWAGFKATSVKCENYLNLDAGTINPIEHGDPFLCEDGTEADMDIGTYEKFLDKNLSRKNFITMGQVYKTVIDRERRFEYKGEDVEAIPYITDEIQKRWIDVGREEKTDIVVVELGGTAGEYQNIFYYEASRILALRNPGKVLHVHVGYMPIPNHLGEPKTKPIQLSVKTLNSMAIQPDFIIARSEKMMDQRRKERFALFCNLHPEDIISAPDVDLIYEMPLILKKQKFDDRILEKFHLKRKSDDSYKWIDFITKVKEIEKSEKKVTVGIVGKYFATGEYQLRDSYAALFDALQHASWHHGFNLETKWIDAENVESAFAKAMADGENVETAIKKIIGNVSGLIVPIGWGPRGAEGMITAAGFARDKKIPYLGLCYGMQLAVVSFARDKAGWKKANSEENDPESPYPVIHLMPAQEKFMKKRSYGGTMRLGSWLAKVKPNTLAWKAYGKKITAERHRHRFEFNDKFAKELEGKGLVISARSVEENLAEIIELSSADHPFYIGTQGHPEYKSRPLRPHPIFIEFIKACLTN